MNNTDKKHTWSKVFIVINCLVIIISLILWNNVEIIVSHEESDKMLPLNIIRNNVNLKPILTLSELSEKEYNDFISFHETKLKMNCSSNDDVYGKAEELYNDLQFIKFYGRETFNKLNDGSMESYEYRYEMLQNRVSSEAFDYMCKEYHRGYSSENFEYWYDRYKTREKYMRYTPSEIKSFIFNYFEEKYDEQKKKEWKEQTLLQQIFLWIILQAGLCIFIIASKKIKSTNIQAKNLAKYCIGYFILNYILHQLFILLWPTDAGCTAVNTCFLPSILILSLLEVYIAERSKQEYYKYYLIPQFIWIDNMLNTEYKKRVFNIIIVYPLFYAVPIPIVGMFVFCLFILPAFLYLGIYYIIWGRKTERNSIIIPKYYCRHCGKLIDADSSYCRHCGKKL